MKTWSLGKNLLLKCLKQGNKIPSNSSVKYRLKVSRTSIITNWLGNYQNSQQIVRQVVVEMESRAQI
jgi:hypothetical protein